ncbi:MAG: hypothetical protein AB8B61_09995 [Cyclobacteriaceae bacterium]
MLKAHSGIIQLYLLFIVFKVVLLFVNKPLLVTVRNKTKIVDMVLGVAILVTGALVLSLRDWNIPTWLAVKIALALASIPVAIIAFKKENKILAVISILLMISTYYIGLMKSLF